MSCDRCISYKDERSILLYTSKSAQGNLDINEATTGESIRWLENEYDKSSKEVEHSIQGTRINARTSFGVGNEIHSKTCTQSNCN